MLDGVTLSVQRGHFSSGVMRQLVESARELHSAWQIRQSPLQSSSYIFQLRDEMNSCYYEVETLSKILTTFLPESQELQQIRAYLHDWDNQYLAGMRSLLSLNHPSSGEDYQSPTIAFAEHVRQHSESRPLSALVEVQPMPLILCKYLDWFVLVDKSDLFKRFWRDQCGIGCVKDIAPVLGRWAGFLNAVLDGTLNLFILDRYGHVLLHEEEIKLFVQTATSISRSLRDISGDNDVMNEIDMFDTEAAVIHQRCADTHRVVHHWHHIQLFYFNQQHVRYVLSASRNHLADSQKYRITSCELALDNLCKKVDNFKATGSSVNEKKRGAAVAWGDQTVVQLEDYWTDAQLLDARLLKIPYQLLLAIQSKPELVEWLRTVRDDEMFASSIELARSLQEMNAPIDLWDYLSGRVNERYLSMVSNIRSYLHAFLYETEPLAESFDMFVKVMSELNTKTSPEQIIGNLDACTEVRVSLGKIIGVKTDFSGSSRINFLYSPDCASIWRCAKSTSSTNSVTKEGSGSVVLKYKVIDGIAKHDCEAAATAVYRQYSSADLADFQSNIILEK